LSAKEMEDVMLDEETRKRLLIAQRNELTEHIIYEKLAQSTKDAHNKDVLRSIARDELKHHDFWRQYTDSDVQPDARAGRTYPRSAKCTFDNHGRLNHRNRCIAVNGIL